MSVLQLVSGQAVGTLFDLEESKYMQERMEAEAQYQGNPPFTHHPPTLMHPQQCCYLNTALCSDLCRDAGAISVSVCISDPTGIMEAVHPAVLSPA